MLFGAIIQKNIVSTLKASSVSTSSQPAVQILEQSVKVRVIPLGDAYLTIQGVVCILGKPRLGHPSRPCAALTKYPLQGPRRTARTDYYERYRHSNFPHHPINCLRHDTAGSQVPFPLELEHAAAILSATQPFESAGSRVPSALLSPALRLSSHHGDFSTSTIVLRGQREK